MRATMLAIVAAALAGPVFAQPPRGYLDVMRVRVRPEKAMEFETSVKKMADLNHRYKGDTWICYTTEYGDGPAYFFSSGRENMAAVETGMNGFMKSLSEGLGPAGTGKLLNDMMGASISTRTELRRRRWDLSTKVPAGPDDIYKVVGQTRWMRVLRVEFKPGRLADYTEAWKPFQKELEDAGITAWVTQNTTGPSALYFASYYKSMADMDTANEAVQKAVSSSAYRDLQKAAADTEVSGGWEIYRYHPELSNPPEQIAAVDPAFWRPKPAAMPKSMAAKPPAAKPAAKQQ